MRHVKIFMRVRKYLQCSTLSRVRVKSTTLCTKYLSISNHIIISFPFKPINSSMTESLISGKINSICHKTIDNLSLKKCNRPKSDRYFWLLHRSDFGFCRKRPRMKGFRSFWKVLLCAGSAQPIGEDGRVSFFSCHAISIACLVYDTYIDSACNVRLCRVTRQAMCLTERRVESLVGHCRASQDCDKSCC